MRSDRDVEQALRAWMRDEEPASADLLIDRVTRELSTRRQRSPSWWDVQRMSAVAAAAVLVAAVSIGLAAVFSRGGGMGGLPASEPVEASPDVPRVLSDATEALRPGTYTLGSNFPVELTFSAPDGFEACVIDPAEQGLCASTVRNAGLTFVIVDNLVDDPCSRAPAGAEPPIGPTVDDLVLGLSNLPGFLATPVQEAVVDGQPAQTFTLTAPPASACPSGLLSGETWIVSPDRTNSVAPGERNELFIMNVQGERLMIAIAYQPSTPTWAIAAMRDIVETVQFGR